MSFYIFERFLIPVPHIHGDSRFNRQLIAFKNGWGLSTFQDEPESAWWEAGLWHGLGDDWLNYTWFPEVAPQKQFLEWAQKLCPTASEVSPAFCGLEYYTQVANFSERELREYGSFLSKLPPVNLFTGPERFGYWRDGVCLWGPVGPRGWAIYREYLACNAEQESRDLLSVYLDHCEDHLEG